MELKQESGWPLVRLYIQVIKDTYIPTFPLFSDVAIRNSSNKFLFKIFAWEDQS